MLKLLLFLFTSCTSATRSIPLIARLPRLGAASLTPQKPVHFLSRFLRLPFFVESPLHFLLELLSQSPHLAAVVTQVFVTQSQFLRANFGRTPDVLVPLNRILTLCEVRALDNLLLAVSHFLVQTSYSSEKT